MRSAQLRVNGCRIREFLFLVEMLCLEQFRLVGAFGSWIRLQVFFHFRQESRGVAVVEVNQPLIVGVLCFLPVRILCNDLPVDVVRLFGMPQLALTVAHDQHHFRAHFLRELILPPFVFRQHFLVLTGLILQSKQSDLRNCTPATGFRQGTPFLQQTQGFLRHRLVGFALLRLL